MLLCREIRLGDQYTHVVLLQYACTGIWIRIPYYIYTLDQASSAHESDRLDWPENKTAATGVDVLWQVETETLKPNKNHVPNSMKVKSTTEWWNWYTIKLVWANVCIDVVAVIIIERIWPTIMKTCCEFHSWSAAHRHGKCLTCSLRQPLEGSRCPRVCPKCWRTAESWSSAGSGACRASGLLHRCLEGTSGGRPMESQILKAMSVILSSRSIMLSKAGGWAILSTGEYGGRLTTITETKWVSMS